MTENVFDMYEGNYKKSQEAWSRLAAQPPLKYGGGGGNSGDMEARINRLEEDMREAKADLKVIRADLAEVKGKVSMLPGYGGIALIVAVVVGLATLAQVAAQLLPKM